MAPRLLGQTSMFGNCETKKILKNYNFDHYALTNLTKKITGLPWCKNLCNFSLFVAIVRVRVYYVDFFYFFVLSHC